MDNSTLWEMLSRAEAARQQALSELQRAEAQRKNQGILFTTLSDSLGPRVMGRDTTGLAVTAKLRMERVPTGIVHLLDSSTHPLVTFEIENVSQKTRRLRVETYVEGYSASAVDTLEIPKGARETVSQLVTFFPDRIRTITEITRATLHMKVSDLDGTQELHQSRPIWLLARDSAYLTVRDPSTANDIDLTRYLAAWVTPHVSEVLTILRTASDTAADVCLAGYQGDRGFVERQVRALYRALQDIKIMYVNTVICFGAGVGEHMQRIRLPRESITTRAANCVDGTVLFASLLEAASLNAAIVLVPGHAFLAWQTQREGELDYLETTVIGTKQFEDAQHVGRQLASRNKDLSETTRMPIMREIDIAMIRSQFEITPME
jgi:hypothetical protein